MEYTTHNCTPNVLYAPDHKEHAVHSAVEIIAAYGTLVPSSKVYYKGGTYSLIPVNPTLGSLFTP